MKITEEYLMSVVAELGPVNKGRIPWKIITKPMLALVDKGWTLPQIFAFLKTEGVELHDDQLENFKVHGYRKIKAAKMEGGAE